MNAKFFSSLLIVTALSVNTFAQSLTDNPEFITHKIPLNEKATWRTHSDFADLCYTTDSKWVLSFNDLWCVLSNDGSLEIFNEKPKFEDACNDMISLESYLSLEQNSWNFHDEEQKKKFKYMFENDDNGTYLIISVKKHI